MASRSDTTRLRGQRRPQSVERDLDIGVGQQCVTQTGLVGLVQQVLGPSSSSWPITTPAAANARTSASPNRPSGLPPSIASPVSVSTTASMRSTRRQREDVHNLPLKDQPGLVVRQSGLPGLAHGAATGSRVEPQHLLLELDVDRLAGNPHP